MPDDQDPSGSEGEEGTFIRRVERDPSFTRYYADSSTAHQIGAEIDVAFLSVSPQLREITWRPGSTQPVGVKIGGPVAELCRVRLDGEAANNLAMNLLLQLTSMGELSVEALRINLSRIIEAVAEERRNQAEAPETDTDA